MAASTGSIRIAMAWRRVVRWATSCSIGFLRLTGDVDGNGHRDAVDVQLVVNDVLGLGPGEGCDVNHDGATNAVDIQAVIVELLQDGAPPNT